MIIDERTITYINSLESGDSPFLRSVARAARDSFVPIIRRETASLMKTLVEMKRPSAILEVGTAVGYSALLMAEHMPAESHITTIEKYAKRIPIARENFRRSGMEEKITLIEGDAADVLKRLEGPYDLIFMDAAKGQYIHFLPEIVRLLAQGGILISDNVLQDGDLIESRFAVTRRNRTIHARMREYLYELKHHQILETAIIPIGDGVTISVKKSGKNVEKG